MFTSDPLPGSFFKWQPGSSRCNIDFESCERRSTHLTSNGTSVKDLRQKILYTSVYECSRYKFITNRDRKEEITHTKSYKNK